MPKLDKDKEKLDQIGALIKSGRGKRAAQYLKKFRTGQLSGRLRAQYAALARRTKQPELSLKLLNKIVRKPGIREVQGSVPEQIEYAAALLKVGGHEEGLKILDDLKDPPPQAYLHQAAGHISQWNYKASTDDLEKYLQCEGLTEYQKLVGRVNLAAAYVYLGSPKTPRFLEALESDTRAPSLKLAAAELQNLWLQWHISQKNYQTASQTLSTVASLYSGATALDNLFLEKWTIALELFKGKILKGKSSPLQKVREHALALRHWETLRDCDFLEAISGHRKTLLTRLWFGSPWKPYRDNIIKHFEEQLDFPDHYLWQLTSKVGNGIELVETGLADKTSLDPGGKLHNLLIALSKDFYRPQFIAQLHSFLFPNEFFNPLSSPNRIYQLVKRLRQWLKKYCAHLEITEQQGTYCLKAHAPLGLWVPQKRVALDSEEFLLGKIHEIVKLDVFTVGEVANKLKIPAWTLRRAINIGVQKESVYRVGIGKATKFTFQKPARQQSAA